MREHFDPAFPFERNKAASDLCLDVVSALLLVHFFGRLREDDPADDAHPSPTGDGTHGGIMVFLMSGWIHFLN